MARAKKEKETKKKKSTGRSRRSSGGSKGTRRTESSNAAHSRRRRNAAPGPLEDGELTEPRQKPSTSPVNNLIWGIILVAVGAFVFIAVEFQTAGEFGNALGDLLKGCFGVIGILFPWYLIFIGVLLIFQKTRHFTGTSIVAIIIIFVMLCFLNAGRFIDPSNTTIYFEKFFDDGVLLKSGGAFGMSVGMVLVRWFGKAGLYLFSVVIILISILVLVKTPLTSAMEQRNAKQAEDQKRREEAKQNGVPEGQEGLLSLNPPRSVFDQVTEEDGAVAPFVPQEPVKNHPKSRKSSNVLDVMKKGNLFGARPSTVPVDAVDMPSSTITEVEPPETSPITFRSYGMDQDTTSGDVAGRNTLDADREPVNIEAYEGKKASAAEIARGAAEIGEDLGLKDANAALTKAQDKTTTTKYKKPPVDLLEKPKAPDTRGLNDEMKQKARILEKTLQDFNVDAKVVQVTQGPAITRYEIQPNVGVKVSKITNLSDDIALNLRAKSIRIEAPIPGKAAVGIEVENDRINMVRIREIIDSKEFRNAPSKIEFAVGKDIAGKPIVADLKSMPHLLIAGSTGSGKSVCINSIITSILYKANPDEVKMVLIDPKVVELGNYNGIPHLLIPVVTDPSKSAAALSWAVVEMTNRYKMFAEANVRDLSSYNRKMKADGNNDMVMPQVVIIIDELADLMMAAPSQVEESICRLAQMARAAGMHLIVATQRPSVDVITGLIKANIPSRIAFAVSSMADSRTILDRGGAEHLVGKGDMLFNPLGVGSAVRVQGTFVSDEEVQRVIDFVKDQSGEADYSTEVLDSIENGNANLPEKSDDADELLPDAIECVVMQGQASVSMLQRRYRIGYNRAARIVDEMEARGIVGPQDGSRPRQVLMTEEELEALKKDTQDISE